MNNYNFDSDISFCPQHKSSILTNYCVSQECLVELCPECIEDHFKFHHQMKTLPQITSIRNGKEKSIEKIQTIIISLHQEMEKCQLNYLLNPHSILEEGIKRINDFKEKVIEQVKTFCHTMTIELQKNIENTLLQINDFKRIFEHMEALIKDLEFVREKLIKTNKTDSIRKISLLDVQHLIKKFRNEINLLLETKTVKPIRVHIDENRLQNCFLDDLNRILWIDLNNIASSNDWDNQIQNTPSRDSNIPARTLYSSSQISKPTQKSFHATAKLNITVPHTFDQNIYVPPYLHFFQSESKYLHLLRLDTIKKNHNFELIKLDTNIVIPNFHRSIAVPNGDLYLVGGAWGEKEQEKKSEGIFVFDFKTKELHAQASLLIPRSSHALCYVANHIYIVGGLAEGQIPLEKCERFNILTREVTPVADMNYAVASTSICPFFNDYIFRFGGITCDTSLSQTIEKYDIIKDKWTPIKIKVAPFFPSPIPNNNMRPKFNSKSGYNIDPPSKSKFLASRNCNSYYEFNPNPTQPSLNSVMQVNSNPINSSTEHIGTTF